MKRLRVWLRLVATLLLVSGGSSSPLRAQSAAPQEAAAAGPPLRISVFDAEALARKNNPRITVSRLNALATRQVSREVSSFRLPSLSAYLTAVDANAGTRITAGGLNNPVIYDRAAGGVSASQLITDFGRTSNLVATSKFHAQADEERAVATEAQITLAVDQAFYDSLETEALSRVAAQTVTARQAVADQIGALTQSKLRSDLDLSFAQVNLAEAKLLLLDAENNRNAALASLSALLGYGDQRSFELIDETGGVEPPSSDVEFLIAEALDRRPEVLALDFDARAADHFRLAERDLQLPSVRALGAFGAAPYRNDHLSANYAAVGINVEIPVFSGFLFTARAQEADYRAKAARENLADLRNEVAKEVRTSWLNATTAYSRLDVTRQLRVQAENALDLARTRYQLGLSSIVELSQAELQETQAAISDTDARYRYRYTLSALRFEVGGP